jgi:hypothetical protein
VLFRVGKLALNSSFMRKYGRIYPGGWHDIRPCVCFKALPLLNYYFLKCYQEGDIEGRVFLKGECHKMETG